MTKVFLSYQQADHAIASRIYQHLTQRFGRENVMVDESHIEPETGLIDTLSHEFTDFNVMVAVIGKSWATHIDPRVGQTLEHGLNTPTITVVPVLVDDSALPTPSDLPPSLSALAKQEAITIHSDQRFAADAQVLSEVVEGIRPLGMRGMAFAAAIGLALMLFIALIVVSLLL